MHGHSSDRFIVGVLLGGAITAALAVVMTYFSIPSGHYGTGAVRLAISGVIASCILFPRPLLFKTLLRSRRDVFLLDEDLNALLLGRAVGVICGLFAAVAIVASLF
ncbi:conserved membrane hypothetical protein [Paraburkholderia ribeironis]|uniref:Transmembrane protein n=1 Tax=Paraburkholderia ribeironis TaxID=1247936 RepID=A0A1N7S8N9_9BURK|nr:conserved membrane hypothetical protein [Paraburkholderia ribeironis]